MWHGTLASAQSLNALDKLPTEEGRFVHMNRDKLFVIWEGSLVGTFHAEHFTVEWTTKRTLFDVGRNTPCPRAGSE
jgi:hypothetical protein